MVLWSKKRRGTHPTALKEKKSNKKKRKKKNNHLRLPPYLEKIKKKKREDRFAVSVYLKGKKWQKG